METGFKQRQVITLVAAFKIELIHKIANDKINDTMCNTNFIKTIDLFSELTDSLTALKMTLVE